MSNKTQVEVKKNASVQQAIAEVMRTEVDMGENFTDDMISVTCSAFEVLIGSWRVLGASDDLITELFNAMLTVETEITTEEED